MRACGEDEIMLNTKHKFTVFDAIVHVVNILIAVAILYPMVHLLAVSLSGYSEIMAGEVTILPKGFSLENYLYFLGDSKVLRAYGNSIIYTAVGVACNLAITLLTAYPLSRNKLMGRSVIMKLIIFTLYFSGGTIPLYLVVKGTHLLDTMWSLIIPNVVWTMELIIMISFFKSIPPSLYEAAELDGAGEFQTFVKVALPLSKASIASIALFFFIGHWNSYYNPMLYLNEPSKYPMQLVLRNMLLENTESVTSSMLAGVAPEGIKSAIIVLTMIPVLIIYPFVQKFFVKGVTVGAVKG